MTTPSLEPWTIVIHCANTPNGYARYGTKDIDDWHRERGFHRTKAALAKLNPQLKYIGYQGVIEVDGLFYPGRGFDEEGAHCRAKGLNFRSWGICMIGKTAYTLPQWVTLRRTLIRWIDLASTTGRQVVDIIGHGEADARKAKCPGFDVGSYLRTGGAALPQHICELRAV